MISMEQQAAPYLAEAHWSEVVYGEILTLTMVLRRNDRFVDSPWLEKFQDLRLLLESCQGELADSASAGFDSSQLLVGHGLLSSEPTRITLAVVLEPFLEVIKSGMTTGPIASAIFVALAKFLSYNLIQGPPEEQRVLMAAFADTVTNFKFEPTDAESDGVALMRFLDVLEACIQSSAGAFLTDDVVCKMMETCFGLCFQMRIKEQVRRAAEHTLCVIVQVIFRRLQHTPTDEDALDTHASLGMIDGQAAAREWAGAPAASPSTASVLQTGLQQSSSSGSLPAADAPAPALSASAGAPDAPGDASAPTSPSSSSTALPTAAVSPAAAPPARPFGIASARALIAFLSLLTDPNNHKHTDTMRGIALTLTHVMLEVGGRSLLRFPSLMALVRDGLSKSLFLLATARESKSPTLLAQALRTTLLLLHVTNGTLRAHLEFFLSRMLQRLKDDVRAWTPEAREQREQLLAAFAHLAAQPHFFVSLYVNYDCAPQSSNVLEEWLRFIVQSAVSDSATAANGSAGGAGSAAVLASICADLLLGFVTQLEARCRVTEAVQRGAPVVSPDELMQRREHKRLTQECAAVFNESASKGIAHFIKHKFISHDKAFDEVARVLRSTAGLSKAQIGAYVSKNGNEEVLRAFVNTFEFANLRIDEAIRLFVEAFRLPGEAKLIERIIDLFSKAYMDAAQPAEIADVDSCTVIAFAIVMLNTDQHNASVRHPMTFEQFKNNMRATNNRKDFHPDFLRAIYDNIKKNEILLPEEHDNAIGEDYRWKVLLQADRAVGPMLPCRTSVYDRELFVTYASTLLKGGIALLDSSRDDLDKFARSLAILRSIAAVAAHHRVEQALEEAVTHTAKATLLVGAANDAQLLVSFGTSQTAQLATSVLFEMAHNHGGAFRGCWLTLVDCLRTLHAHRLLPAALLAAHDLSGRPVRLPLPEDRQAARSNSGGFLAYLWSQVGGEEALRERSVRAGTECAASLRIEALIESSATWSNESLAAMMDALACAQRIVSQADPSTTKVDNDMGPLFVELMLRLILRNDTRASTTWPLFHRHLALVFSPTSAASPALVDRAIVALFRAAAQLLPSQESACDMAGSLALLASEAIFATAKGAAAGPLIVAAAGAAAGAADAPTTPSASLTHAYPSVAFTTARSAPAVAAAVESLVRARSREFRSAHIWRSLLAVMRATTADAVGCAVVVHTLDHLFGEAERVLFAEPFEVFGDVADLLQRIIAESAAQDRTAGASQAGAGGAPAAALLVPRELENLQTPTLRAAKAVVLLAELAARVSVFKARVEVREDATLPFPTDSPAASTRWLFEHCWLRVLSILSENCYHSLRAVSTLALSQLQKTLLLADLAALGADQQIACFQQIIFPLLDNLLLKEVSAADAAGKEALEEARVRACYLTCKMFLHYMPSLSRRDDFIELWTKLLGYVDRYLKLRSELLHDTLRESLKNMLLVMSTSGVLVDPQGDSQSPHAVLWSATWAAVHAFLPDLQQELFPDESTSAAAQPPAAQENGAQEAHEGGTRDEQPQSS